jgi:hypothetical protein
MAALPGHDFDGNVLDLLFRVRPEDPQPDRRPEKEREDSAFSCDVIVLS